MSLWEFFIGFIVVAIAVSIVVATVLLIKYIIWSRKEDKRKDAVLRRLKELQREDKDRRDGGS